jgi:hypothetical protein
MSVLAAALTMASASALAGEITLFQDRGFGGDSVTLQSPMRNLERNGFAAASSAVVRSGVWEACTGANFRGTCAQLQPGEYANLSAALDDPIASAREIVITPPAQPAPLVSSQAIVEGPVVATTSPAPAIVASDQPRIALYERPGFGGASLELTRTMGGLDRAAVYQGANAAVVYGGVWRLCSREYFRGACADFAPGRYADLGPLTGRVNSAELVALTGPAAVSVERPY